MVHRKGEKGYFSAPEQKFKTMKVLYFLQLLKFEKILIFDHGLSYVYSMNLQIFPFDIVMGEVGVPEEGLPNHLES